MTEIQQDPLQLFWLWRLGILGHFYFYLVLQCVGNLSFQIVLSWNKEISCDSFFEHFCLVFCCCMYLCHHYYQFCNYELLSSPSYTPQTLSGPSESRYCQNIFYLPFTKVLTQLFSSPDPQIINDIPKVFYALGTDPSFYTANCYFSRLYKFLRKDTNSSAFTRPGYSTHPSLSSEKPTTSATLCCYTQQNLKLIMVD